MAVLNNRRQAMRSGLVTVVMAVVLVACGGDGEEAQPDAGGGEACPDRSEVQPAPVASCYVEVWDGPNCDVRTELPINGVLNWQGTYGVSWTCVTEDDEPIACEWAPCIRF